MIREPDCWNTVGVRGTATCERLASVAHCRNCPDYIAAGRMLLDHDIPEGASDEWARLIAEPKQSAHPGSVRVIVFRIGGEWLALRIQCLQQATQVRPVHRVPARTNRVFQGLVNVDGELLLCFSAGEALGLDRDLPEKPGNTGRERLLIASSEGQRFAFPVDEVLGVRSLAPDALSLAPATVANAPDAVTASVFSMGARRVGLLNETRFFQHITRNLSL